jgi:carbon-monoxide dehydrogenase small subunit
MDDFRDISVTVNGEAVTRRVPVRRNLVDFLRQELGLTGTHVGCEQGVCGACTVLLNGRIVRGCLLLAVQADGTEIATIEGVAESGAIKHLQDAFHARNASQCGFCTPGMLLTAQELLSSEPELTRERVREYLSGNFCRCTGYHSIVDAIMAAAKAGGQK